MVSLSTPNVFFLEGEKQVDLAREVNDAYAELIAKHSARFKGFASIPMDAPEQARPSAASSASRSAGCSGR